MRFSLFEGLQFVTNGVYLDHRNTKEEMNR